MPCRQTQTVGTPKQFANSIIITLTALKGVMSDEEEPSAGSQDLRDMEFKLTHDLSQLQVRPLAIVCRSVCTQILSRDHVHVVIIFLSDTQKNRSIFGWPSQTVYVTA